MPTQVKSTHIVGGEMTFECNGDRWYTITLTLRRDCSDDHHAPFDETARVVAFDGYGTPLGYFGGFGVVQLPMVGQPRMVEISNEECYDFCKEELCVEEAVYSKKIRCQYLEAGYIIAYQRCCRNESLDNILNPLETGGSWFVCLSGQTLAACENGTNDNDSPVFKEWPDIAICKDEPYVFDHSAFDDDGDSLAYKLYAPFIGASREYPVPFDISGPEYDTVTYVSPYSSINPMNGNPRISIDPSSGLLTVTPDTEGQFLVGVLVEEWRNDSLLSKVRRDFEINVCGPEEPKCMAPTDTLIICEGDVIPLIPPFDTIGGCTYSWMPDSSLSFTDSMYFSDPVAQPDISTLYRVNVSNEFSIDSGFVYVKVFSNPESNLRDTVLICDFDSCTTLSFPSSSEYTWNPEPHRQSEFNDLKIYEFCPEISTQYKVTITNPVCPEIIDSIYFEKIPGDSIRVGIKVDTLICDGKAIIEATISDTTNFKGFEWSYFPSFNPIFSRSAIDTIVINQPLQLFLRASNSSSCSSVDSVFLKPYEKITDVSIQNGKICFGDTVNVVLSKDARDSVSVQWFTNGKIIDSTDCELSVVVTSRTDSLYIRYLAESTLCPELSCDSTIYREVISSDLFIPDNSILCDNDSCIVIAVPIDGVYDWTPAPRMIRTDNDSIYFTLCASESTQYFLEANISDCNEILDTLDIQFIENDSIEVSIIVNDPICDSLAIIEATISDTGYSGGFEWSFSSSFNPIFSTSKIDTIFIEQPVYVYLRAAGTTSCIKIDSVLLAPYEKITDVSIIGEAVCKGDTVEVILSKDARDSLAIQWFTNGSIIDSSECELRVVVDFEGDSLFIGYNAQSTLCPDLTCDTLIGIQLMRPITPEPTYQKIACTYGVQFDLPDTPSLGRILWDFGDTSTENDTSSEVNPIYVYPSPGSYVVTLSSLEPFCSFDSIFIEIEVPEIIELGEADTTIFYCNPDSLLISLDANVPVNIDWYFQDTLLFSRASSIVISPSTYSEIIAIATDSCACMDTTKITLQPFNFDLEIGAPGIICENEEFNLFVNDLSESNLMVEWILPNMDTLKDANLTISGYEEGPLEIELRVINNDIEGCIFDTTLIVEVLQVQLSASDTCIIIGEEVSLFAENNAVNPSYEWRPVSSNSQELIDDPDEATFYTVAVTENEFDKTCVDTLTISVIECIWDVPRAFTPTGDGMNDEFKIRIAKDATIEEFDMKILNRWGEEVFSSDDPLRGWDGTYRNKRLAPDVYAYCILVICPDGSSQVKTGNVTLLR